MQKKLNIGILGCASIAKKYAIKAFQALEVVGGISIASRQQARAEEWAKLFHIEAKESYDALVADPKIDAVYIPLPIGLHEEWALKTARAGKHVLCEKSLAHSLLSAKKIVEGCRQTGVVLFENFMCDYHPQHGVVLSLIQREVIGNLFVFRGYFGFPPFQRDNFRNNRELGGGSLNDAGAYPVFMARKILASEPLFVTCRLAQDLPTGVDRRGSAYLEFPDGKIAFVGFGFDNAYQNNYSVWGSQGFISIERAYSIPPDMTPSITLCRNENSVNTTEKILVPPADHFELIFRDFCKTVLGGDVAGREEKFDQIIKQATILEAMRMSSAENKKIRIETVGQYV